MAKEPIDFWFSIGSLYTYPAVMRVAEAEAKSGTRFHWRPFSVRTIMIEMDNLPGKKPLKMTYFWRDLERRAGAYGLPFRPKPPYPVKNYDLVNGIALVGAEEGWCSDFVCAAYMRWFTEHDLPGSESNNEASLRAAGQDPARVLPRATSEQTAARFKLATDEARQLGIFGVPTFMVGNEMFWGDDRLDDAVAWHRSLA
jgi:2-hydroxychromene-2-carboxylate isomerase